MNESGLSLPESLDEEIERRSWRLPSELRGDFMSLSILEILERQGELGRQLAQDEVRTAVDTCRKRLLRDLKRIREEQPLPLGLSEDESGRQEDADLIEAVMDSLGDFSDQDVDLFYRVIVEKQTYKELSELMSVTENALRQRMFRMRRAVKKRFPGEA